MVALRVGSARSTNLRVIRKIRAEIFNKDAERMPNNVFRLVSHHEPSRVAATTLSHEFALRTQEMHCRIASIFCSESSRPYSKVAEKQPIPSKLEVTGI
jgi:hypothetical protein